MNNVEMYCKDFYGSGTQYWLGDGSPWGDWMFAEFCPKDSYVCGVNARVEDPIGSGDDTSVNELEFFCCSSRNVTW